MSYSYLQSKKIGVFLDETVVVDNGGYNVKFEFEFLNDSPLRRKQVELRPPSNSLHNANRVNNC